MKHSDPCIYCNLEITNPICASCYYRHIVLWLNDKSIQLDNRMKLSKAIKKALFIENGNDLTCILCHKNEVSICYYCFFKNVDFILHKLHILQEYEEDFNRTFHYELYSDYTSSQNKRKLMQTKDKPFV